VNDQPDHREEN
jgi:septin family protein